LSREDKAKWLACPVDYGFILAESALAVVFSIV